MGQYYLFYFPFGRHLNLIPGFSSRRLDHINNLFAIHVILLCNKINNLLSFSLVCKVKSQTLHIFSWRSRHQLCLCVVIFNKKLCYLMPFSIRGHQGPDVFKDGVLKADLFGQLLHGVIEY